MRSETRSGFRSGQMKYELRSLIYHFVTYGVRSYLEVGARYGDTFYDVMRALPKGSRGVCVDLPESVWGSSGTKEHLESACEELRGMGYDITLIIGDSRDADIVEQVRSLGPFDAALIDGDHRYEGVLADFANYSDVCSLVAFHDIVGTGQRHSAGINVEVPRLWGEVKNDRCSEYVAPGSTMGIGVWTM